MGQNKALRANSLIWYLRCVQIFVVSIVLAITATNAADWHNIDCGVPRQLQVNVACALLTAPFLLYFLPATGRRSSIFPWSATAQLLIDSALLGLWIFPSITAPHDCDSICHVCLPQPDQTRSKNYTSASDTSDFYVWVGKQLTCSCFMPRSGSGDAAGGEGADGDTMRKMAVQVLRSAKMRPGTGVGSTRVLKGVGRMAAKEGSNWVMMASFGLTLFLTALAIVLHAKRSRSATRFARSVLSYQGSGIDMEKHAGDGMLSPYESGSSSPGTPKG